VNISSVTLLLSFLTTPFGPQIITRISRLSLNILRSLPGPSQSFCASVFKKESPLTLFSPLVQFPKFPIQIGAFLQPSQQCSSVRSNRMTAWRRRRRLARSHGRTHRSCRNCRSRWKRARKSRGKAAMSRMRLIGLTMVPHSTLTSPIITLTVGREGRLFAAHEDVLSLSPFFAAVCRGKFLDAQSQRIDLPEEEPEIFSCVLEYLYVSCCTAT
jgi:hypothetical protein